MKVLLWNFCYLQLMYSLLLDNRATCDERGLSLLILSVAVKQKMEQRFDSKRRNEAYKRKAHRYSSTPEPFLFHPCDLSGRSSVRGCGKRTLQHHFTS
jgi:hypothetical protein